MPESVLVVRHGETPWTASGRVQGWAPVSLTDRGRRQAESTATYIAQQFDVDEIVSSDLQRTRETAERLAEESNVPVTTDSRWRERDYGLFQGLTDEQYDELRPTYDTSFAPESGESWEDVAARVREGWSAVVESSATTPLVVSHFGPISILLGTIREQSLEAGLANDVAQCSIHEISLDDGQEVAFTNRLVYE